MQVKYAISNICKTVRKIHDKQSCCVQDIGQLRQQYTLKINKIFFLKTPK